MAEIAGKYLQHSKNDPIGVIGYDVAGDEGTFPLNSYSDSMTKGILRFHNYYINPKSYPVASEIRRERKICTIGSLIAVTL